jgi:carboxymethylenebutenolidase
VALNDYLVQEIAHDFDDGLLTRREALRRLGLLGLSLTGAGAVLAACSNDDDKVGTAATSGATSTTASTGGGPPGKAGALTAQAITFKGAAGDLKGAYAAPADPKGSVLVVHENRGLRPHFFDVTGRLAGAGYAALTVDLLSRKGGTDKVGDEAAAQAALGAAALNDLLDDLKAGIDELQDRAVGKKVGAVGFCFGGGMVWQLLNAGESRLSAAAPFYGPCPDNPNFSRAKAAVLAVYGGDDGFVNPTRERAVKALESANLPHEVKVYDGAGHAFFNDTGQRYNAPAAAQAWSELTNWFGRYL